MLVIRQQQARALDDAAFEDFLWRMQLHLVANFGTDVAEFAEFLRSTVRGWVAAARGWGLTREEHVQAYLELCAEFPELREDPLPEPLVSLLTWPGRSAEHKLERLQDDLFFEADAETDP
jgi:hypothetical protein